MSALGAEASCRRLGTWGWMADGGDDAGLWRDELARSNRPRMQPDPTATSSDSVITQPNIRFYTRTDRAFLTWMGD